MSLLDVLRFPFAVLGMVFDVGREMQAQNRALAAAAAFAPETCPTPRGRGGRGEAVSDPPPGEPASPLPGTDLVDGWVFRPEPGTVDIPAPPRPRDLRQLRMPDEVMDDAAAFIEGLSLGTLSSAAAGLIIDLRKYADMFRSSGERLS